MAQSTKEGRVYTEGSGTYGWSPVKGVPASAVLKPAASGGFRYSMSGAPLGADLGSIRAVRPDPALSRPGERVLPTSPEHVRRERGRQRDSERGRRGSTQAGLRSNLQAQRKERVKTRGGMTEQERAFKKPAEQARGAAELSRPMRSVGGKPIVPKRVDLSVEGESDGLLPMDEPHEGPLREIPDIFPEKFQGAAGMKSGALVKKQGRSTSVEFNGERAVQDYISGEVDELIYGESLDPAAASAAREVPMLYPEKYMNAAGFTSKEVTHKVHRNKLQERLDNPEHKAAKPHFIGGVDRIIYGKPTAAPSDARAQVDEITKLPARGGWSEKAGVTSKKALLLGMEKLDKRLEGQIQVEASRHMRSQADEVMYHHKLGGEQRNDGMEFDNV